jgi:PAS domain-containing protein
MDRRFAEAVLREKERRETEARRILDAVSARYELTGYHIDKAPGKEVQAWISESLGMPLSPQNQRLIKQVLFAAKVKRVKNKSGWVYRGLRKHPSQCS